MANGHGSNGNGKRRANGKHNVPLSRKDQQAAPKDVDDELLRTMALELRREGASYRTIASEMTKQLAKQGKERTIDKNVAHRLVVEALNDIRSTNAESAEVVKQLEIERLDVWTMRLNASEKRNTPRTIDTLLRIAERRARLLGTDAPKKIGLGGLDGGPLDIAFVDSRVAIREKLDALRRTMQPVAAVPVPPAPTNDNGNKSIDRAAS